MGQPCAAVALPDPLTPEESEHLKTLFQPYRDQLEILHSLDLDTEEPAVTFDPVWHGEETHDDHI